MLIIKRLQYATDQFVASESYNTEIVKLLYQAIEILKTSENTLK